MSPLSRRQFLEDSMFAAASAAVAGIAGSPLLAHAKDEGKQSASPNERLSVCVIGTGGRGGEHISWFPKRKDTSIAYLCDADTKIGNQRVEQVASKQSHKPTFVQDLRKALDDKSVDVVTIATPNHWHSLAAIWALQAGKDVYVEKPVSHNVSEGRRVVQVARKLGRICQTGTQCRSNAGMKEMIEYVRGGKIGKVSVARALCYKRRGSIGAAGKFDPPATVDYNLWLGPAPLAPNTRPKFHYDWHWQWPYGNGDLGNQGIHQMDIARWGLGVDVIGNAVFSYGGRFSYADAGETANTQIVAHDYGDKTLIFEVRGLVTPHYKGAGVGVIFEGSEGYLVNGSYDSGAAFNPEGKMIRKFSGGGDHLANFIQAVRSRKHEDLNADILEGHLSSALCHLGNISYRHGAQMTAADAAARLRDMKSHDNLTATFERFSEHLAQNKVDLDKIPVQFGPVLKLDPKTETFVGNDNKIEAAANAMLTRDYRAPFVVPAADKI